MLRKVDYSIWAPFWVLFISFVVLLGWLFDITLLKSVFPGLITMKANTAVCFCLIAIAVLAARRRTVASKAVSSVACSVVIAVCVATLVEYLRNFDLGIDEFLFRDPGGAVGHFPPGRLAPVTAFCFIGLSLSIFIEASARPRLAAIGHTLALIALVASFQSLVGFMIGVTDLFGSAFYTQMAVHTSVSFILISGAVLTLNPDRGVLRQIVAPFPSARMTRGLLAAAILIPLSVVWVSHRGLASEMFDANFAQLFQVVGVTTLMSVIIIFSSTALFSTERENAKNRKALEESEQKFRALVDTSAQIVWSSDADGRLIEDSPSWRAFTGQTAEQWRNGERISAVHPADRERAVAVRRQALRSKSAFEAEYRIRHRSGEWRWTLARGTPLANPDGSIRGWVGMNSDINDRKLIEIDLKEAKEEAERANELKSAFLANMSHEIRTPLTAMIGFTDLLREPQLREDDRQTFIDVVHRNGSQLAAIIDDILDLSKVEAGHLKFEYLETDVENVVTEVVGLLTLKAQEKRLVLSCDVALDTRAVIVTDPVRLKQIMLNIVGNAIKFTNAGHVHLSVQNWTSADARAGLEIEVEDSGIGIPDSQKKHVFEMFVQADGSMTRRFGGTGLGLSLSKKLAVEMGGDVLLKASTPGVGTTFAVQIEDRRDELRSANSRFKAGELSIAGEKLPTLHGVRVLVIDDAPDNQDLISHYLGRTGAQISSAENGLTGSMRALQEDFDIVLMDLQMPIMDGFEATRKLREGGYTKPIIALTAHAMGEVRRKSIHAGCNDHLVKPINFKQLIKTIDRYVRASGE